MSAWQIQGGQLQGKREHQEDSFVIEHFADGTVLAGVADGLGGHPAGDLASREGLLSFTGQFASLKSAGTSTPRHWLDESMHTAQRHLLKLQRHHAERFGMATTLVAIYLKDQELWAASVGDSYLLRLRRGTLLALNELHGGDGGVTSAIGFNLTQIDLSSHLLEPGDRYLLASDGILTLNDDEIFRVLTRAVDADAAVRAMLALVEKRAHPHQDNVTVIPVFV